MNKEYKQILKEYEPKTVDFIIDELEQVMLNDLISYDMSAREKLHRDLTEQFNSWYLSKFKLKEQVKVNIKGRTRSGKSLIGLKLIKKSCDLKKRPFLIDKVVCSNQSELKKKLNTAEYGDNFLVDENAFANVGEGSNTELRQLTDINNIIAKNNNDIVYITPQQFLNTGAEYSLQFYAKDINNWLSKFLLFHSNGNFPVLIGYVIFNVGTLFQETGCLMYKQTGGCTNPRRLTHDKIESKYIKNSSCIQKDYNDKDLVKDGSACPFYNICSSEMNKYEKKKDAWIKREMSGGLNYRELERYELSLKLYEKLWNDEEKQFDAKNKKELYAKIKIYLPFLTNSKFTISETNDICELTLMLKDPNFKQELESKLKESKF